MRGRPVKGVVRSDVGERGAAVPSRCRGAKAGRRGAKAASRAGGGFGTEWRQREVGESGTGPPDMRGPPFSGTRRGRRGVGLVPCTWVSLGRSRAGHAGMLGWPMWVLVPGLRRMFRYRAGPNWVGFGPGNGLGLELGFGQVGLGSGFVQKSQG